MPFIWNIWHAHGNPDDDFDNTNEIVGIISPERLIRTVLPDPILLTITYLALNADVFSIIAPPKLILSKVIIGSRKPLFPIFQMTSKTWTSQK